MIKALFIHLCASIRTQLFWFRTSDFISWPRKIWEMSFDVHCTLPRNTLYAVLNRFQAKTRSTNPKISFRRVLKHGIGSSLPPVFACPWPGLLNTIHAPRSERSQQERQRHKRNNQEITGNTKNNLFDRMLCYGISGYPFLVPRLRLLNSQFAHCKSRNARNEAGGEARRGEAWISADGMIVEL